MPSFGGRFMAKLIRCDNGEEIVLTDGATSIGRRSASTIQVNQKQVSRRHCVVEGPAGGWVLTDAGSKLGTYVNGRRTRRRRLESGDEIKVGSVLLVFREAEPAAAGPEPMTVQPLSDSSAMRLLPGDEVAGGAGDAAEGKRRRSRLPVLVAGAAAAVVIGAFATVLILTRRTPEKVVREAGRLLRGRKAGELWQLLSRDRRIEMTRDEFKDQVGAVANEVVLALERLDVGRARRGPLGIIVPFSITVRDTRRDGEVVLYREDGEWRIHAVSCEGIAELVP